MFQIITDRRSSRLTVLPLAEKEMKANGAELRGGICEETEEQGKVTSLEVICSRTCWTAIPVACAPTKRHPSHFYHLHHLPSPFLDLSYFLCLLKMPPLLCISPLLPVSFNKSYFCCCLFLPLCSLFIFSCLSLHFFSIGTQIKINLPWSWSIVDHCLLSWFSQK